MSIADPESIDDNTGSTTVVDVVINEDLPDISSLQNTLDSALGTPEIGAVNFNCLHQVVTGILKHLENESKREVLDHTESFVDINNSIDELRKEIDNLLHQPETSVDEEAIKNLTHLQIRVNHVEGIIDKCATKEEIKDLVSYEYVQSMMNKDIETLRDEVHSHKTTCNESLIEIKNVLQTRIDDVSTTLEEMIKEKNNIEMMLATKADSSALLEKCDKKEIESLTKETTTSIKTLQSAIKLLENHRKSAVCDIEGLKSKNEEFTDRMKILASTGSKIERNLEDVMDAVHHLQSGKLMNQQPTKNVDEVVITKIRISINEIQEQQCRFQDEIDNMILQYQQKELILNDFTNDIRNLEETKVDHALLRTQLSHKADKDSQLRMVTTDRLDNYSNELDHRIAHLTQEILAKEAITNKMIKDIFDKFNDKMDRNELKEIRGYIDERFNNFKPKYLPVEQEITKATATRKPLLPNSNCISCDQVVIPREPESSPLPCYQALPVMKSIRPAATFELQNIRQHMSQTWTNGNKDRYNANISRTKDKLQKEVFAMNNVESFEELACKTKRSCGGEHTSVIQEQKSHASPPMLYRQEYKTFQHTDQQKLETDVMGKDGHVYKGRLQDNNSPYQNRKEQNKRFTPSPPRVRSPKLSPTIRKSKTPGPGSGRVSPISLP